MALLRFLVFLAAGCFAQGVGSQERYSVKVAYFPPAQHFMGKWLHNWGDRLEKASGGRLSFVYFPGSQMGPAPAHYDLARTRQAEVSWFLHGATPGRFPLTDLISLPYMAGSASIGTKALNDPQLRAKYLDPEHRGVKPLLLFTSTPTNLFSTRKAVRTVEDLKAMRVRFASTTTRDFLARLGATPVGVQPTEMLDQLQKGGLDGVLTDYGGAATAFKMAGTVKHATEIYCCVVSFGIAMNTEFFDRLPGDLKALIERSVQGVEAEVGDGFDGLDELGKTLLVKAGASANRLSAEQEARFRQVAEQLHEETVNELRAKAPAAQDVYRLMRGLAEQHSNSKNAKSFWK